MFVRLVTLLAVVLAGQLADATPFRPWGAQGYRIVNAMGFSPDAQTMFVALFPADVAKFANTAPLANAPEVALYQSRRQADGWSTPELMPFAGTYQDYEPAVSPDGSFIIFNSQRPMPDDTPVPNRKNNLWLTRRTGAGWSNPVFLKSVNRLETEESYASVTSDGRVVYVQQIAGDARGEDYNIHIARLVGDDLVGSAPLAVAATTFGESDPWIAPDGSYLIFTRWDRSRKWEEDVDLYITFNRDNRWTTPLPLTELNVAGGPDYGVTISAGTVYWKARGTVQAPWAPILEAARKRSQ